MRTKIFRRRYITPEQEVELFMIGLLIFVILITVCAFGFLYAIAKLVIFFSGNVNVGVAPQGIWK